ncbi:glycosyltransferase [uncultured Draconibacterium sp.]|uniref:glycosyltransferase n=1 Tax=uncultured Draconibacterium sp. TaxID=1573823 RepID=UPI0025E154F0|nr:glycosyltransferase [uncultured Draconibacterium sp.]
MAELVIFTTSYPYGEGETFLETEIKFLNQKFSTIHIFPLTVGKGDKVRMVPDGVTYSKPFFRFDINQEKMRTVLDGIFNIAPVSFVFKEFLQKKVYKSKRKLKNLLETTCAVRKILAPHNWKEILAKIDKITIIYFYWGDKATGIIPFISKNYSNVTVARFHNSDLYEDLKGGYIPFREELLKNLEYSVFISEKGKAYLTKKYHNLNFKTKLFRLGVPDLQMTSRSEDDVLRIISCSYVVPVKRLDLIVKALTHVKCKVKWTHLGGGKLLPSIKDMIKSLPPNVNVSLLGQVSNIDVINYYQHNSVDLFVNVSASEGIPVSIMEAISSGIPIIATNVGGTSEIVDNSFGTLLHKDFEESQLATLFDDYYLKNEDQKMIMRRSAKEFWFKHFNSELNYKNYTAFLKGLTND